MEQNPSTGISSEESSPLALTKNGPPDLLLVVFIHGFKGTDTTFGGFPERLQHVLSETVGNVIAECIVFPQYETKGELNEAVERFADWLTTLTVDKEVASGVGGGAGKAKIVLCGHSMGGLLAADTLLAIVNNRADQQAPVWPRIIACIAFDTPYLGLHPSVFKNTATKAAEYISNAKTVATSIFGAAAGLSTKNATTSTPQKHPVAGITGSPKDGKNSGSWGWGSAAYAVGGALLAGAAAGTAYYKRDDLNLGLTWATDHMQYIGNLWDEDKLKRRVDSLIDVEEQLGIVFRTFFTVLPPAPPDHRSPRTFILIPPRSARSSSRFLPAWNRLASDELQAHTGMFGAQSNDGYYELGLETAKFIRDAVMLGRGIAESREEEAEQKIVAGAAMVETMKKDLADGSVGM